MERNGAFGRAAGRGFWEEWMGSLRENKEPSPLGNFSFAR